MGTFLGNDLEMGPWVSMGLLVQIQCICGIDWSFIVWHSKMKLTCLIIPCHFTISNCVCGGGSFECWSGCWKQASEYCNPIESIKTLLDAMHNWIAMATFISYGSMRDRKGWCFVACICECIGFLVATILSSTRTNKTRHGNTPKCVCVWLGLVLL